MEQASETIRCPIRTIDNLTEKDLVRLKSVSNAFKKSNAWTTGGDLDWFDDYYLASVE